MFPERKYGRKKGNFKAFISIVLIILFTIYRFMFVDKKVKPSELAIAEVKAKEIAMMSIEESVDVKMLEDIKYQDIIFIRTDTDRNVTMI